MPETKNQKIVRADTIGHEPETKAQMGRIFVDGFYQWLKYFSKDKNRLKDTLSHMFNLDVFYVVLIDDKIAGIAALNDGTLPTVELDKREFRKHLGFIMGSFAYMMLKKEFVDTNYPFERTESTGYVEFVATAPEYRGQGVASALLKHFFSLPGFTEYVLEAADTNENAVRLYEELGFIEFKRVEMKNKKQSGVNFLLYMKYTKD